MLNVKSGIVQQGTIASIYSIEGKLLMTFMFNGNEIEQIPVTDLQSGMYILSVGSDGSNTSSFVVAR